jgi:hypothetical protein
MLDFKPSALPPKRGKLINFTPSFFIGLIAALVLIGSQIYLTLFEKPVGTRTASAHTTGGGRNGAGSAGAGAPQAIDPDTGMPIAGATDTTAAGGGGTATSAPSTTTPADATAGGAAPATPTDSSAQGTSPATPTDSTNPGAASPTSPTAAAPTSNPSVALAPGDPDSKSIFTPDGADGGGANGQGAAPADAGATGGAPPADAHTPAPTVVSTDPLARGFEQLMAQEYAKAIGDLDTARLKYVVGPGKIVRDKPLTPQQEMTLEGLAAAYIGLKRYDAARGQLDVLYVHNVRSRSLTLNLTIYSLNTNRQLADLVKVAEFDRQEMGRMPNDEYAADIFGTLINKISTMDRAPKDKLDQWWKAHDNYIDSLAARGDVGQPGKLKWGIEWLPAEDVQNYRNARNATSPDVGAAAKEVQLAQARVKSAETALRNATAARTRGDAADVAGAQSQLEAANTALVKAQKVLNDANAAVNVKKPRWLSKFDPVIPAQKVAP